MSQQPETETNKNNLQTKPKKTLQFKEQPTTANTNTQQQDNNDIDEEQEHAEQREKQLLARFNQPVVSVPGLLRRVGNHIEIVTRGETSSEQLKRQLRLRQQTSRFVTGGGGGTRSASAQAASFSSMKKKDKKKHREDETNNGGGGDADGTSEVSPLHDKAQNEVSVTNFMKSLAGDRGKRSGQISTLSAEDATTTAAGSRMIAPPTRGTSISDNNGASESNISNGNNIPTTTSASNVSTSSGNEHTLQLMEKIKMNDEMIHFLEAQTAFDYEIVGNKEDGMPNSMNVTPTAANESNTNPTSNSSSSNVKKPVVATTKTITDKALRREVIKQAVFHLQKTHPALAAYALANNNNSTAAVGGASSTSSLVTSSIPSEQLQDLKKEFRRAVQYSIRDYVTARKSQQLDTLFQTLGRITRPDGYYKMHTPIGDGAFGQTHLVEWVPSEKELKENNTNNDDNNSKRKKSNTNNNNDKDDADSDTSTETPGGTKVNSKKQNKTNNNNNNESDDQNQQQQQEKKPLYANTTSNDNASNLDVNNSDGSTNNAMMKKFRMSIASNPAGAVSYLSCSRQFIPGADGTRISRERAFVCKMETRTNATRRAGIVGTGQSEHRTLANCAHPNIVSFVDKFSDSYNDYLIMEFIDGTDLREEVKRRATRNPPKLFSISSVLFLFVQTLLGVEYLHRHNILHRDLKTANILISFKWQVKICDLGFAKEYEQDTDGQCNTVTSLGTPYYMAPEILLGHPYGEACDIFSLGVILYEVLSLQRPFTHQDAEVIADRILHTDPVPVTEYRTDIPPELVDIMNQCLRKDQKQRPSAKTILKTPIFAHAVEDYINKMRSMSASGGSAVDKWWVQVLEDHQRLVLDDFKSAQKSRNAERGERRTAMSTTGTRFLQTTMGQM